MARDDNQSLMTTGYHILEWDPGVPILDDDKEENEITNAMKKLAYYVHVYPDEKYGEDYKDGKDTGKDDKSDGHDDGDKKEDPYDTGV